MTQTAKTAPFLSYTREAIFMGSPRRTNAYRIRRCDLSEAFGVLL